MYGVEQQRQAQHAVCSDKQKTNLTVGLFADCQYPQERRRREIGEIKGKEREGKGKGSIDLHLGKEMKP